MKVYAASVKAVLAALHKDIQGTGKQPLRSAVVRITPGNSCAYVDVVASTGIYRRKMPVVNYGSTVAAWYAPFDALMSVSKMFDGETVTFQQQPDSVFMITDHKGVRLPDAIETAYVLLDGAGRWRWREHYAGDFADQCDILGFTDADIIDCDNDLLPAIAKDRDAVVKWIKRFTMPDDVRSRPGLKGIALYPDALTRETVAVGADGFACARVHAPAAWFSNQMATSAGLWLQGVSNAKTLGHYKFPEHEFLFAYPSMASIELDSATVKSAIKRVKALKNADVTAVTLAFMPGSVSLIAIDSDLAITQIVLADGPALTATAHVTVQVAYLNDAVSMPHAKRVRFSIVDDDGSGILRVDAAASKSYDGVTQHWRYEVMIMPCKLSHDAAKSALAAVLAPPVPPVPPAPPPSTAIVPVGSARTIIESVARPVQHLRPALPAPTVESITAAMHEAYAAGDDARWAALGRAQLHAFFGPPGARKPLPAAPVAALEAA